MVVSTYWNCEMKLRNTSKIPKSFQKKLSTWKSFVHYFWSKLTKIPRRLARYFFCVVLIFPNLSTRFFDRERVLSKMIIVSTAKFWFSSTSFKVSFAIPSRMTNSKTWRQIQWAILTKFLPDRNLKLDVWKRTLKWNRPLICPENTRKTNFSQYPRAIDVVTLVELKT